MIPKAESHTKFFIIFIIYHEMSNNYNNRWYSCLGVYSCNGLGVMWSYPRKVLDLPLTVIQTPMLIVWVLWDTQTIM